MKRKRSPAEDRLEALKTACDGISPAALVSVLKKALKDAHQLVVAKAAVMCAENNLADLEKDLATAYRRFLKNPVKKDPQCRAKTAVVRAMVELGCSDETFFIDGIRYRQPEPVWGGSADTAADLRLSCAVGLANTSYPRSIVELAALLYDPEPQVRTGVLEILERFPSITAEALLRCKILSGDSDASVIAEALTQLLKTAPETSKEFVAGYFDSPDNRELKNPLALALGASKLDAAIDILFMNWEKEPLKSRALIFLRAAVLHRSEKAFSGLLNIAAEEDDESAMFVVEELSIYKTDASLSARLQSALETRDDDVLWDHFHKTWSPEKT